MTGTGAKAGQCDNSMGEPFFREIARQLSRVLKPSHGAYICCDWRTYPTAFRGVNRKMRVCNCVIWDWTFMKQGFYLRSNYEMLVYATNNRKEPKAYKSGGRGEDELVNPVMMRTDLSNLWAIKDTCSNRPNKLHPSQKPVELIKTALTSYKNKRAEVVIDTFAGCGSVMMACEELGMSCRSVELDEAFCSTAVERWETATGLKAEKIMG